MGYTRFEVEPISPTIGAEVRGLDLAEPLDEVAFSELNDAWMRHLVLFFRDQKLSIDQHKDFARRFGSLHVHPVIRQMEDQGHPEIMVLESDAKRPFVAERWHSDVTFQKKPPLGSILRAVDVPETGGDTMWASMYAAYDALSETFQGVLGSLRALHHGGGFRAVADSDDKKGELEKDLTSVHPVIRTHPITGRKALFVNSTFTKSIEGMHPKESKALLRFLFDHIDQPEFAVRFHWKPGSIAMWDNRCTQHRVLRDNVVDHRRMERVTIEGDAPF